MQTPLHPTFIQGKTGVYKGIQYFLSFFALKKDRGYSLTCTHNLCFEQKYENCKKKFNRKLSFLQLKKSMYVTWVCFCNEIGPVVPEQNFYFSCMSTKPVF